MANDPVYEVVARFDPSDPSDPDGDLATLAAMAAAGPGGVCAPVSITPGFTRATSAPPAVRASSIRFATSGVGAFRPVARSCR